LKDVGTKARLEFENLSGQKVFLKLFVKVVEDWRNREQALDELGLDKR
jgi:GTP-binding protein Era